MVEQLCALRDQHGFEVAAVVSGDRGGLIDRLRAQNIPFHVANFDAGVGAPGAMLRMPLNILRLARLLRRERFDVVQTHIFKSMVVGRPAAWLADVPVRLAMISGPFHLEAYSSRWIERSTYWMETQLIPACEKSRSLCRELGVSESHLAPVIYYAADPAKFDPAKIPRADIRKEFGWPSDTPIICHIAYFYPRMPSGRWIPKSVHGRGIKGHGDLIKSMPFVLSEFPNAKLLLVGKGWTIQGKQYMEDMRKLVRQLELESSVIFTGYRTDVNSILNEADIAMQPSLSENCGGAIEALMLGKPTIVTPVGGLPDVVKDEQTGIIARASDPQDLARGILELLREPEKARTLGQRGRAEMLARFTLERTAANLAELYLRLTARHETAQSYDLVKSIGRSLIAVPVFAYMIFRLVVLDMIAFYYLDRVREILTSRARPSEERMQAAKDLASPISAGD